MIAGTDFFLLIVATDLNEVSILSAERRQHPIYQLNEVSILPAERGQILSAERGQHPISCTRSASYQLNEVSILPLA